MEEFCTSYIKQNEDGNQLAKVYLDFVSAVDFIQSMDRTMLAEVDQGREYIKDFNLLNLHNCLYLYPEDQTDLQSHNTSYNMFGGFGMSQRAQSFADHASIRTGHDNRTSNHLKTKQLRLLETRE